MQKITSFLMFEGHAKLSIDFYLSVFKQLSAGGPVLMPLAPYPFSKKFAWVSNISGVSWQLSLV